MAYVYILRTCNGDGKAYVGFTFDVAQRLATHKAGKGAIATCGTQWEFEAVFGAPGARIHALRFESLLQFHMAKTPAEIRQIALQAIQQKDEFRDFELQECLEG
eukprot:5938594-Pleurochrysis_carterae.AAC.2